MEAHDCHYGTPLHVACARQHYDCAKVLLSAGESMFIVCKPGIDQIEFNNMFGYVFYFLKTLYLVIRSATKDYFWY